MNPQKNTIFCGGNLEVVASWPPNCIDSVLSDPPYGLEFMGKEWDKLNLNVPFSEKETGGLGGFKHHIRFGKDGNAMQKWHYQWAKAMLRITKPGGFLLCFGGTRTVHRLACAIEDAGWEIRDCMMWLYGQGFPKSHNIKKALEKKYKCGSMEVDEEAEQKTQYLLRLVPEANLSQTLDPEKKQREILQSGLPEQGSHSTMLGEESQKRTQRQGQSSLERRSNLEASQRELQRCKICALSEGLSEDGQERWLCNGTPFSYGTTHWSSAPANRSCPSYRPQSKQQQFGQSNAISDKPSPQEIRRFIEKWSPYGTALKPAWEPILVCMKPLDGTFAHNAEAHGVAGLNIDGGRIGTEDNLDGGAYCQDSKKDMSNRHTVTLGVTGKQFKQPQGRWPANLILDEEVGIGEPWKRYFYCAKTSRKERNMGLDDQSGKKVNDGRETPIDNPYQRGETVRKNTHPTVKPLALMRYLCTLLKMPSADQIILDPFLGSGTTGIACKKLGISFIGIEKEREYCEIAVKRIAAVEGQEITLHIDPHPAEESHRIPAPDEHRQSIINAASAALKENRK